MTQLTANQQGDDLYVSKDADGLRVGGATTWASTATADNAAATVTKAAEAGKQHFITGFTGSFSATATKLLTIKDGAAVKTNIYVVNSLAVTLARPIRLTENSAAELSLAASGGVGNIGAVTLFGYTQ